MSLEQPLVGTSIPPIFEETSKTTPVVPRRGSETSGKLRVPGNIDGTPECINKFASETESTLSTFSNNAQISTLDAATLSSDSKNTRTVDERVVERRKSLVPMSTMEEENLRERLHLAQLKKCNEIVFKEPRYSKDTFRRLFQTKQLEKLE
ncbi:hypothetical protein NQ314_019023 [Rhamnusium bicolor]|uniref:Uncharacterized protein n=1 Tax=Rhamnusium bicolor TaxID=1586634 RepID=A0AAV8WNY2_9CUCU|nr:hypothetical protein NQ314_019023 [Rhamnusium bicolor]